MHFHVHFLISGLLILSPFAAAALLLIHARRRSWTLFALLMIPLLAALSAWEFTLAAAATPEPSDWGTAGVALWILVLGSLAGWIASAECLLCVVFDAMRARHVKGART